MQIPTGIETDSGSSERPVRVSFFTLEEFFGQLESTIISRFLGRWPNDSVILGDNGGSPGCSHVVFAALPKEGRRFGAGGKYSEAMFARVTAETQVAVTVGWRREGVSGTAGRGELGYIPSRA